MKTMKNVRLGIGVARCCSLPQRPIIGAAVLLLALLGLSGTSGCTMCPDPFDYSGPVPNGSAPQNNFLARSNGILPLGASTKPWPPLVKAVVPTPPLAEVELVDALEVDAQRCVGAHRDQQIIAIPTENRCGLCQSWFR